MKLDRIIWGILLLFIGGVLLLENFGVIEFYWRTVWHFWPVFLIIAGVNILFNRNNSQNGSMISIAVLVVALTFLFFKGQQRPEHSFWNMNWGNHSDRRDRDRSDNDSDDDDDNDDDSNDRDTAFSELNFTQPFLAADSLKKTILNISGGGISFDTKGSTNNLIDADVKRKRGNFSLTKIDNDSTTVLNFNMNDKKNKWTFGDGENNVGFKLNKAPNWEVIMKLGAGSADLDLSDYKIRTFRFDGGVAALDIKLGDLLPITDVVVKSGMAGVKIKIPRNSGCRIKTKTGLSSRDFDGFDKITDGVYETPNYKSSTKKIFINFDGGLSSFEVDRY